MTDLKTCFEEALPVDAFERLLNEEQAKLHALHGRRAAIGSEDVEAIRDSAARYILVITEPWCGDSLAILPVLAALFRKAGCEVRVALRDQHPELIDRYLTNGGRAVPIAVILDGKYRQIHRWGPRPAPAQQIVTGHREVVRAGRMDKVEVYKKVRAFYAADIGRTVIAELIAGLRS